jgi:hypothetical protein
MSDVVIPDELVDAVRKAEAARRAVPTDGWAPAIKAAEEARALRAPLEAEHGGWAVMQAIGKRLHEDDEK